jgi:phosphoribosyl 1,2-cyclic phosphodiesterase
MSIPTCNARLCVLASSSKGNSSVITVDDGRRRRACLIDAGLSPRRTFEALEEVGVTEKMIDCVILTHLDVDHFHAGWPGRWPSQITLRMHKRHLGRAERMGALSQRTEPFVAEFEIWPGVTVTPQLAAHDQLGTAAFKIAFPDGATLGFATDVGRVNDDLVDHLRGVDVLAIESNYCPRMQVESARPEFLKRRIMNGSGHLSNEECVKAVKRIRPRSHVVLLHLSRECNDQGQVTRLHEGAGYAVTIADPEKPTAWVEVRAGAGPAEELPRAQAGQAMLFS